MSLRKSAFLLLAGLLLLSLGCAGPLRKGVRQPFVRDISLWPEAYTQNYSKIRSFVGKARFTIESPEYSGHVGVKTYFAAPDTLFIHAEGPLGVDVGKIFIGPHRFIVYNPYNNNFVSGSLTDPYINNFLQTDIRLNELKTAAMGLLPLPSQGLRLSDPENGVFSYRREKELYRYTVNPVTGLLDKFEIVKQGKVVVLQEFKNYQKIGGLFMPALIRLTLPQKTERLSIFYQKLEVNVPIDSQTYSLLIGPKVKQLNRN